MDETNSRHALFMQACLRLARRARDRGNTPVGSVVVLDGRIVGEAMEQVPAKSDPTGHAEILACRHAVENLKTSRLDGAVLYTTAEPCFMCAYVIRQCRIAAVVYGTDTADVGGVTSQFPILTSRSLDRWRPAPRIVAGILAGDCQALHVE